MNPTTYTYSGKACTPTETVTLNGKTLVKDTDYTVAYSDNINSGTGKVTITLIGNYSGTVEKTFTITKANGSGSVAMNGWTYGGTATSPVPTSATN